MHPPRTRWGARILLIACLSMLIETACSHAPPPATRAEVYSTIKSYEESGAVVRFHMVSGSTIVTSNYSSIDSTVVIYTMLRAPKYYNPTEAKLYQEALKPPPKETSLPLEVPLSQIKFIEKWEPRSVAKDVGTGVLLFGGIITALVIWAMFELRNKGAWEGN